MDCVDRGDLGDEVLTDIFNCDIPRSKLHDAYRAWLKDADGSRHGRVGIGQLAEKMRDAGLVIRVHRPGNPGGKREWQCKMPDEATAKAALNQLTH